MNTTLDIPGLGNDKLTSTIQKTVSHLLDLDVRRTTIDVLRAWLPAPEASIRSIVNTAHITPLQAMYRAAALTHLTSRACLSCVVTLPNRGRIRNPASWHVGEIVIRLHDLSIRVATTKSRDRQTMRLDTPKTGHVGLYESKNFSFLTPGNVARPLFCSATHDFRYTTRDARTISVKWVCTTTWVSQMGYINKLKFYNQYH